MMSTLKPEAKYEFRNETKESLYNAYICGEAVTGIVTRILGEEKKLIVALGNSVEAELPWDEATIYQNTFKHKLDGKYKIPDQIFFLNRKKIRVKITKFSEDGTIELSRKQNMLETWRKILGESRETIYDANVSGCYSKGVFYDIGEGICAFCYVAEYSKCRINIDKWYKNNSNDKVVIIEEPDENNNYRISVSRKRASKKSFTDFKPKELICVKLAEPVYQSGYITGYYAEVAPNVVAIMDVFEFMPDFEEGDEVLTLIRKVDGEKGRMTLDFIDFSQ